MKRRDFLKRAGFLASVGVSGIADVCFAKDKKKKRKPNVIFIITDDQDRDSFGFLNGKALTPHIDKLAAEGVFFNKAYVTTSVCTPSRYTCLTGRYASRCQSGKFLKQGITEEGQTWVHWNADIGKKETNIAKTLRDAGYATGVVGKLHGFEMAGHSKHINIKSDHNDPEIIKTLKDDQRTFAAELKEHGFTDAKNMHRGNLGSGRAIPLALCEHAPEWTAEGAINFIEENKDQPFYLYYATTLLHGPSPMQSLKADPRISEIGMLDKTPDVMPSRQSVFDRVKKADINEELAPATWLDDSVGAILNKIEELGLKDDTLVIYFNDHASEGGKGSLYQGGIHTQTIISWPGKIKPAQSEQLISNIDFVPTILNACKVKKPSDMKVDGRNLMPLLTGKKDKTVDSLFFEIGYTRAVVTDQYKYLAFRVPPSRTDSKEVRMQKIQDLIKKSPKKSPLENNPEGKITHIHRSPGGDGTELGNAVKHYSETYYDADQLYDVVNDPRERVNLADDPKYAEVLKKMKGKLKKHLKKAPGTFAEFKS
ncbi:MAG: sulfatase-like hydrolase/transferase [Phycisphaerae bacterium]|nr:sulfatase-like hydrolase/transferase [Phycisphaerae bacterium]